MGIAKKNKHKSINMALISVFDWIELESFCFLLTFFIGCQCVLFSALSALTHTHTQNAKVIFSSERGAKKTQSVSLYTYKCLRIFAYYYCYNNNTRVALVVARVLMVDSCVCKFLFLLCLVSVYLWLFPSISVICSHFTIAATAVCLLCCCSLRSFINI